MSERPADSVASGPPPQDRKMPCGCFGVLRQGNERLTWLVTASSFLCKHKQGDVVVVGEASDNAA